jgi:hypothetical protein
MENQVEIWKIIDDYPDYKISNFGNVKSCKFNKEILLKTRIGTTGYKTVAIYKNKKLKNFQIHQLVAINFLNHNPCGYKLVINHKDFNRQNNHVDNLEIVTVRQNTNRKHLKSSSKYVGVSLVNKTKKWVAQIRIDGKKIYLGYFDNEINAHFAYQNKLKEIR